MTATKNTHRSATRTSKAAMLPSSEQAAQLDLKASGSLNCSTDSNPGGPSLRGFGSRPFCGIHGGMLLVGTFDLDETGFPTA